MTYSMASIVDIFINLLDHPLLGDVSFSSKKSSMFQVTGKEQNLSNEGCFGSDVYSCSGDAPLPLAFKTENNCV